MQLAVAVPNRENLSRKNGTDAGFRHLGLLLTVSEVRPGREHCGLVLDRAIWWAGWVGYVS